MTSSDVRYKLKKPLVVYILAMCFIAAPIGNVIASMIGFGVYHWYSPSTFTRFIGNISWVDRSWLILTLLAGFSLLYQRKWAWLLAISAMLLTSIFNFYHTMQYSGQLAHGKYFFPILFMLSNISIVAILYHFRFPYLDRREAWWGIYPRFRCNTPVTADGGFSGVIMNISRSGAFVEGANGASLEAGKQVELSFGPFSAMKAEVVHSSGRGIGIEFKPTPEETHKLKQFVQDLATAPIGDFVITN